jgi:D-3-phosphoglycerate dehydrogenase
MKYCKENNIEVWHLAKDYELINQLPSTAEHAFGLMLSLIRKIPMSFHSVRDGNWDYEPYIGRQLKGLTVGIIGYGRLGKMMETYCHAFGMTVKIHDPYEGYDDLDLVLRESDVISLHVHVTGKTVGMINGKTISKMEKKPYLINTSRGEVVYEKKVIEAIEEGKLSGYATDVITDEFGNIHNSKLVEFSMNPTNNVIITPHVGGMTWEGQTKAYKWAINKFKGEQNEVN